MVLVWDMLVLDIEVLAMLDTDMVSQLMDTPDLDITARDLLMLKLSLRQRLMLDFSMEDMDMDMVLDMQVLDTDMVVLDMDILIMVKLYLPSFSKQKLKAISDWQCNIQCPGMKGRNCFELINISDHNQKK